MYKRSVHRESRIKNRRRACGRKTVLTQKVLKAQRMMMMHASRDSAVYIRVSPEEVIDSPMTAVAKVLAERQR
jgi:hypothetical protein